MKRAALQLPISKRKNNGAIAQLVEQRTENPCVPGSIPGGTTPPFIGPVCASSRAFFYALFVSDIGSADFSGW